MCPIGVTDSALSKNQETTTPPTTCFTCTRLNDTTFLVVEDDKWSEYPFIYVKVYDSVLVLIDTGCGGAAKDETTQLTSLRKYLETYSVAENDNRPLNPGSQKRYVILCSHCHFDHIGAIAQFTDTPRSAIWASSYQREFIERDLPTSSLCRFFGMETPEYTVTDWADDGQHVLVGDEGEDLGLVIYHTPGHTPDEIAVWDPRERVLFVGDTMYEWAPIVFPLKGSLRLYSDTLGRLKGLVQDWNAIASGRNISTAADTGTQHPSPDAIVIQPRVKIACGHTTNASDAEELINDVDLFLYHVLENMVEPRDQGTFRDEPLVSYDRDDGKISFIGPGRLFDEFRSDDAAMQAIRMRQSQGT